MNETYLKLTISVVGGLAATMVNAYGPIFLFVCMAITFDVITGLLRSVIKGVAITSKKARRGFWRKIALLVALTFGVFIDYFIPLMLSVINITVPDLPFTMIIGCYICLNEIISIIENLMQATNYKIFPPWMKTIFETGKKAIEQEGQEVANEENRNN